MGEIKYYNNLDDEEKDIIRQEIKEEREKLFQEINASEAILSPNLDFEETITIEYSQVVQVKLKVTRKKDFVEQKQVSETDVEIAKQEIDRILNEN